MMANNSIKSIIYPGVKKFYYLSGFISSSAWHEKIQISMHVQPCIGCYLLFIDI